MTAARPDWTGALTMLQGVARDAQQAADMGDEIAVQRAIQRLYTFGHAVDRLSWCPDMAPVYDALDLLGSLKGQATRMTGIKKQIRTQRRGRAPTITASTSPDIEATPLEGFGDRAGLPDTLMVPGGYTVDRSGVWRDDHDGATQIAPEPIIMSGVYDDVDTGDANVRLSWAYKGTWTHRIVSRMVAADARQIVALSAAKAPITSATSSSIVRYLAAQESASDAMPYRRSTTRQGWHGSDGALGFVLGEIGQGAAEGHQVELRLSEGDKAGPGVLASGLTTSGKLAAWREAVRPMASCPRSLIGLGASTAAALLGILPTARPFVLDVYADSGFGKTSAARAWMSVWGDWRRLELKWDATAVALERASAFLRHLPTFIDDTKHASNAPEKVQNWIYDVCATRGKARGSVASFSLGQETRTIGIITGERPATTMGTFSHQGAMARVLSLGGPQCSSGAVAERLEHDASTLYGTAGQAVVGYLIAERDRDGWAKIRDEYLSTCDFYRAQLDMEIDGEMARIGRRASPYLALVDIGLRVLHRSDAIDFKDATYRHVRDEAVRAAVQGVKKADLPTAAMSFLLQWAASHRARFYSQDNTDPGYAGWAGRWDAEGIHVITSVAEEIVGKRYDWPTVLAAWKRGGQVVKVSGRWSTSKRLGIAGSSHHGRPRCVTVSPAAMALEFGG